MAKAKPTLTLTEMESKMGYRVDSLTLLRDGVKRFYSNLRPVPNSNYERIKEEFEVYEKKAYREGYSTISEEVFPELDIVQVSGPGPGP